MRKWLLGECALDATSAPPPPAPGKGRLTLIAFPRGPSGHPQQLAALSCSPGHSRGELSRGPGARPLPILSLGAITAKGGGDTPCTSWGDSRDSGGLQKGMHSQAPRPESKRLTLSAEHV